MPQVCNSDTNVAYGPQNWIFQRRYRDILQTCFRNALKTQQRHFVYTVFYSDATVTLHNVWTAELETTDTLQRYYRHAPEMLQRRKKDTMETLQRCYTQKCSSERQTTKQYQDFHKQAPHCGILKRNGFLYGVQSISW